jgi:hypothetical protein
MSVYVKYIVGMIAHNYSPVVDVFVDNSGTISLVSNPVNPMRNLHIHARYFYIKDLILGGDFNIHHLPTAKMLADILCSYKGRPNFRTLYAYLVNCARVDIHADDTMHWNTSIV